MAKFKTANKASKPITRARSTKIGLRETERQEVLFGSNLYESNCFEPF